MEIKDKLHDLKSTLVDYFNSKTASPNNYIADLKQKSIEKFSQIGIPNIKVEDWKYTNVSFLNRINFKPFEISSRNLEIELDSNNVNLIVLENGILSERLSMYNFQEGIEIFTIKALIEQNNAEIVAQIGQYANNEHHFTALNTAMIDDGIFIKIDKNIDVETPIHLVFLNDASDNFVHNIRKFIFVGDNSNVKIIESNISLGSEITLNNNVGEFYIGKNSNVEMNFLQNNSDNDVLIDSNYVYQNRDSIFTSFTMSLSGKLTRNYLSSILDDENCNTNYYGIFMPDGSELMDNHTLVNHAKPHCLSNENYRGIIGDKAIGVFNGKIYVAKDAQKTNAYQSNKNILLSDNAVINTKPELEIYADDVKCSHGATSGSLDTESLFYLRARGIDFNTAQTLLLKAFVAEITDKITIPELKIEVENIILKKLNK